MAGADRSDLAVDYRGTRHQRQPPRTRCGPSARSDACPGEDERCGDRSEGQAIAAATAPARTSRIRKKGAVVDEIRLRAHAPEHARRFDWPPIAGYELQTVDSYAQRDLPSTSRPARCTSQIFADWRPRCARRADEQAYDVIGIASRFGADGPLKSAGASFASRFRERPALLDPADMHLHAPTRGS